jgi:hypothetical protein
MFNFQYIQFLNLKDFSNDIFPKTLFHICVILLIDSWSGGMDGCYSVLEPFLSVFSYFISFVEVCLVAEFWKLPTSCGPGVA